MSCSCMGNRPAVASFAFQPFKSFMAVFFEEEQKKPPRLDTTASQSNKGNQKRDLTAVSPRTALTCTCCLPKTSNTYRAAVALLLLAIAPPALACGAGLFGD